MEHLIKQYFHFGGEMLHLKEKFPDFLPKIHQSNDLTQYYFESNKPTRYKKPTESKFYWFFFASQPLKNT